MRVPTKISALTARLQDCRRGSVTLTAAVALPAMLAGAGLAVDYALMTQKRATLQALSDGSAIAAAHELSVANSDTGTLRAAAESYAHQKDASLGKNLTVNVTINEKQNSVTVSLMHQWTPFFAHFLDAGVTPVVTTSTATLVGSGKVCALALKPAASKALQILQNARLEADGCAVYSNSTHGNSISVEQNGSVRAELICAAGGAQVKGKAKVVPSVTTDCPPMDDPLISRVAPDSSSCPKKPVQTVISNQIRTLHPGTYCGGLRIDGTSKVKFEPGEYIIKDGPFEVSDNASIEGVNTGFYFTGKKATLRFDGNTSVSLTAPKDGPMAGLLFYEDRNAKLDNKHVINSNDARVLLGTIYLPNGRFKVGASAPVADKSAYTVIIAHMLDLEAGPTLVLRSDYASTDIPVPDGLIGGRVVLSK